LYVTDLPVHAHVRERTGLLGLTVTVTTVALFVVALDNLVVTTALPAIQRDLTASIQSLEWSVNAYTLVFAVCLLLGPLLGDRYGHRRMFVFGMGIFAAASAGCALASGIELFAAARAIQGLGGAIVAPLSLTLLQDAIPSGRRSLANGVWWSIGGIAVVVGPLAGWAIVDSADWQWIFWLNVPIGIVAIAFAVLGLRKSLDPTTRVDSPALACVGAGLLGIVWGVTRGYFDGWTSQLVLAAIGAGVIVMAAFAVWELGFTPPVLRLPSFRNRGVAASYVISLLASFALFASLFLLLESLQLVRSGFQLRGGLATLSLVAAILLFAPFAAALTVRVGPRPFVALGALLETLALGWFAHVGSVDAGYMRLMPGFVLCGAGIGVLLPLTAHLVIGSGRPTDAANESRANNAVRAAGAALGIGALTAVVVYYGSYLSAHAFNAGSKRALWLASGVAGAGVLVSLLVPRRKREVREVMATVVREPVGDPILAAGGPTAGAGQPADLEPARDQQPEPFVCPVCRGERALLFTPPRDPHTETCPRCYGHGTVLTGSHVPAHMVRHCPDCRGRGYVETEASEEPPAFRSSVQPEASAALMETTRDDLREA
jgi:EmrB/QacA subfamily drug resistance transporter